MVLCAPVAMAPPTLLRRPSERDVSHTKVALEMSKNILRCNSSVESLECLPSREQQRGADGLCFLGDEQRQSSSREGDSQCWSHTGHLGLGDGIS